jgi:hypothetical protein
MSHAGDLSRAIRTGAFDTLDAQHAGHVLLTLAALGWFQMRHSCKVEQRAAFREKRRSDHAWRCAIVESAAFARIYDALPSTGRVEHAREFLGTLYKLRNLAAEHAAGRLDPKAHARLLDHDDNLAELRALAARFPRPQRDWLEQVAQRIDEDVVRIEGDTLRGNTIYFDPYADAAPSDLISTRGRASDPAAALRGWLTRSAAELVPEATKNRPACIAELLAHCGVTVSPKDVRTNLTSWQHKRRRHK